MADPNTVALGVRVPEVGGGANVNPFAAGLDIMRMQQLANENRKFQLQQQAFQGIGGIMSNHPNDEEGGLREILASPYAPYAGEFVNTVRSSMQALATTNKTLAETGKLNYELGDTAIHGAVKFLAPYYNAVLTGAPESEIQALKNNAIQQMATTTAGMTKDQQATALQGMRGIFDGLDGNMPSNATPEQIRQLRLSRLGPMLVTSGLDQAAIGNIIPSPTTLNLPQGTSIGVRMPGAAGGGYLENQFVPHTISPAYASPGGVQMGLPPPGAPDLNAGSGSYVPAPSMGALPSQPPIGGTNLLGGQNQALPPTPPVGQGGPTMQPAAMLGSAGDGTPLMGNDTGKGITPVMNVVGGKRYTQPGDEDLVKKFNDEYAGAGSREFDGFQRAKYQLDNMDNDLDRMAGTPLESGTYGQQRLELARAYNTAFKTLNSFGLISDDNLKKISFDGSTVAAAESFLKSQTLAQFATTVQNFGAQREAAQIIMRSLMAVPGIENSYMGNKLVLEGLRTAAQRGIDYRNFQTEYRQRNNGSLIGADTAFNELHPPEQYTQTVFDKFGLNKGGFTSQAAIENAVQHGWIDSKIAADAFKKLPAARPETVPSP